MEVQRIEAGLVESVVHRELCVESLYCLEELSLVGVIKRFAEKEILQVNGSGRSSRKSQGQSNCDEPTHSHRLPFPHRDGSAPGMRSGQRQSQKLRLYFLVERKVFCAA